MRFDYDKAAETYDKHRGGGGPYLDTLVGLAEGCGARRVLEFGAGTGNNTAAFLAAYPCDLVALELSRGMLSRGAVKGIPARWVRASAVQLPLADGCVDFVFGCYVLHHLDGLDEPCGEFARVLRPGGAVAFVTAPFEFIEGHPMNEYFPSFARIDKARFQGFPAIRDALQGAGFRGVEGRTIVGSPRPVDREYVTRVASKFISTYALIPEQEFEEGLKRLRADIEPAGRLDVEIVWESLIVFAHLD
ncbi:MAG: class I SAM-dependent methyltransferase [Candidatus Hydrogenedentes bacterium]|nr:class I SAM-dependent methyltransferase [Candidatus Hydrogenedentota bacterium]